MIRVVALVCMLVCGAVRTAYAQDAPPPSPATAQPQGPATSEDGDDVTPLNRRVTLRLRDVLVANAVRAIVEQARLRLNYSERLLPAEKRVTLVVEHMPAKQALEKALDGTGAVVRESPAGDLVLVRGEEARRSEVRPDTTEGLPVFGVVTDSATNQRLAGVMTSVKGTALTVRTSDSGNFVFWKVPPGLQVVMVRHPGYAAEQREVMVMPGKQLRVDFALRMGMSRLQDVVTTATGKQRRLELGNDITVLNADSIVATQPITSVTDLLEGRVPGLVVLRTSGAPGDPARIRLRGASSAYLSNDPIVLVDGVRVYAEQSATRSANLANSAFAAPSPLDYLDPHSIETIEVLKGPSAASLYGTDAANGVILITTKRGREGPPRWTVSTERAVTRMPGAYPDLLVRIGHAIYNNLPVLCPLGNIAAGGQSCFADSVVHFQLLNDPSLTVLDRGARSAITLGVSGGSNSLTYSVGGSYSDARGLIRLPAYEQARFQTAHGEAPPDWMQRPQRFTQWSARTAVMAKLGPKADVSLTAVLSRSFQQRSSLETQLGMLMATYLDRSTGNYYQGSLLDAPLTDVLTNYYQRVTDAATQFTNAASLNWRPTSWLTTSASAGLNVVQRADESLLPRGLLSPSTHQAGGVLTLAQGTSVTSTVNIRAVARTGLTHGFHIQLGTGVNYTGQSTADLSASARDLAFGTSSLSQAGSIVGLGDNRADKTTFGWYIEPSIGSSRLWLSTGLRLDGGNTFGARARLAAFPKVSLSYLVSDESFFPFKDIFNTLRLRLAYGHAGVQPGPADRLRLYAAPASTWIDGQFVDATQLSTLGNTRLKPERSTEIEGGFDADLLGDRLSLGMTFYRKTRIDALLPHPLPPSVSAGLSNSVLENVGTIRDAGLELTFGADLLRSDPLTWHADLGLSQNRNVVVSLGPGVRQFFFNGRLASGYPLFGFWAKPILGYADANGDGVLEPGEVLVGDTAVFLGEAVPNYNSAINTSLSMFRGKVAISGGFTYQNGLTQFNQVARTLMAFGAGQNDPGAPLAVQAAQVAANLTPYGFYQRVSTLRFNSLSVRFNATTSQARRFGASSLSIALLGTNLGLRTNYRGLDPSVNGSNAPAANTVIDNGVLPQPRTWQLRVSAGY